jgi:hypothetical protein
VAAVPEAAVAAERAQERLLERVLGAVTPEPPDEEGVDLVPVQLVEAFEGRYSHSIHYAF